MSEIVNKDQQFIWHPFTHIKYAKEPINIVRSEGLYYIDENGNKIMDAISSWWVNLHGHSHPYISKKVSEQLFTNEHSIFSDFTHPTAVLLAERLIKKLPNNIHRVFYSDNGSTAVEVALKMALQYWNNKGENRTKFICFENAYHGDTFGGMSVGARNVFNQSFSSLLFDVEHIPTPTNENIFELKEKIKSLSSKNDIAGFIYEPLVQGASGMLMYEASLLDELISICKQNNILCIADEVMTGFGRTGTFFASEQMENKPDIICLSKGLTGGYMPLGVTACSNFIYEAFIQSDKTKTFFHGHSYTANPTACSAALASLDLMDEKQTLESIRQITEAHLSFKIEIENHNACKRVRCCGTILAVELTSTENTNYLNKESENIASYFLQKGILLRPLGNIFYLIPPYCITTNELSYIYATIKEFLNAYTSK
jgi:adenosylmethionine-8-amino-7-oxononanoate aminotransferase